MIIKCCLLSDCYWLPKRILLSGTYTPKTRKFLPRFTSNRTHEHIRPHNRRLATSRPWESEKRAHTLSALHENGKYFWFGILEICFLNEEKKSAEEKKEIMIVVYWKKKFCLPFVYFACGILSRQSSALFTRNGAKSISDMIARLYFSF